jgi:hypothetical protein
VITGRWSRGSSTGTAPGSPGVTCRRSSVRGRRCGSGTGAWLGDGTWDRVLAELLADADAAGLIDWQVSVDSTVTRAHQHGTNLPRAQQVTGGPTELQESGRGAA